LNIRLTVLVVETARLERRGVNDKFYNIDFLSQGYKTFFFNTGV
jgi:hypothetical protein